MISLSKNSKKKIHSWHISLRKKKTESNCEGIGTQTLQEWLAQKWSL